MDDTNEDSWLYGTSNPDSTTNEAGGTENHEATTLDTMKDEAENEAQALAAVQSAAGDLISNVEKEEPPDQDVEGEVYGEFEDPAHEMEEDEEAAAAASTTVDTSDGVDSEAAEKPQQTIKTSDDDDDDDEDDSDDDINVVIGDIKAAPSTYNIKQRGNLIVGAQGQEKSKGASQGGKFNLEDFEGVGAINGVAAHEFSIDSLEDKPWRKPGADITDYFNYGFNEETWRAYCERQKRFRVVESGVGLASLTQNLNQDRHTEHGPPGLLPPPGMLPQGGPPGMNDQMQMPPPGMMPPPMGGHHHGGPRMPFGARPPRPMNNAGGPGGTSKENAIQVMTAECREYSRPGQMPNFGGPPPGDDPFFPETDAFDYGYEPTQESQWGNNDNPGWVPTGIKELTPGPAMAPPQMQGPPNPMGGPPPSPQQQMGGPPPQMRGPMMGGMPPNMGMGPPPPHVMNQMMMGPGGPPMRMQSAPPPRMMPPQQQPQPQQHSRPMPQPNKEHPEERQRSPSRRNRSRSPHRARKRSKSPSRQRRSRSRSKSRRSRRSRSGSKQRKTARPSRHSRSRSGSKSRTKSARTHRSPSRSKRSRRSHSRTRSKSPKAAPTTSSSSSKKRSEKTEK